MVPYFDYRPGYRRIQTEIADAVARVLDSGQLILGEEVRSFEEEFAGFVGARRAVGVNSGTDALVLALRVIGIGPGDEVLTVANAGVPPVAAIRAVGATPRFVDVDPGTLLIDVGSIEDAITPATRCIVPVHLYGQPVDLDAILTVARARNLRVIEDCAQAHGATYRGRHVGTFGDVGCFSFYPTKNLGAFGDGGACVTDSPELADRLCLQRMYGFDGDRYAHCEGVNSRLDELQAAILRVKLTHLDATIAERRQLAARYVERLADGPIRPLELVEGTEHAYHLFVVRTGNRPACTQRLERAGIGFGVHYPDPVHLMTAYAFLGHREGDFPVSEAAGKEILSLPLYDGLEPDAVDRVVHALRID